MNLISEIERYALDDRGNIPKRHDHVIDCWRYFNAVSNYGFEVILEAVRARSDQSAIEQGRFRDPKHKDDRDSEDVDWMDQIFDIEFD